MSFSELLAAAKSASRPTKDVTITLDAPASKKRAQIVEQLERARRKAASDRRLTAPIDATVAELEKKLAEADAEAAKSLITLRFTRMPGDEWSDITARCPMRIDAPIDAGYGYNVQAVCRLAAPLCGVRVEGEDLIPLRVEPPIDDRPAVNEWKDLFDTISGHEFTQIVSAIYELNVYDPALRIDELKKASATRPA